ncbi:Ubiquitin carboxyl-terminal hydrolase [Globisporangium polare]
MASQLLHELLAPRVRVARASDRVYRDECAFSFDSALSASGLFTNLGSFTSFGAAYVPLDLARSPNAPQLYLHQKHRRVKKAPSAVATADGGSAPAAEPAAPTKLAIGGEGGFAVNAEDKYDLVKTYELVALSPQNVELLRVAIDSPEVPQKIQDAVQALLNHAGNTVQEEVSSWTEELKESRYADALIQLPDAPKISSSPSAWKCQAPSCDKQENLWLNLSDGFIGCGRKNWDGTGGCGAALDHYKDTGSLYPLAVKLGTITAEGGDVYSYAADEDDMVTNKHLKTHLQHFGININNMKKTDKSMNELQVGLNMNYEFDKITESGKKLQPVSGAGYIGFKNLGNSCYMNSVLQLFLALPEVKRRYFDAADVIFSTATEHPADDLSVQMAKLANAALSDAYKKTLGSGEGEDEDDLNSMELRPSTFRGLVGKGHPDFSTGQQQDAVEYFQHLLEFLTRSERVAAGRIGPLFDDNSDGTADLPSASLFKFAFEDRVECLASKKVKYVARDDSFIQLQIPLDAATNASQVNEYQSIEQKRQRIDDGESKQQDANDRDKVVPVVPFHACVDKTLAPEVIEDFLSSATGKKGLAQKTVRFKSFPRYLLVQMRRFYVSEDWTPEKLDVIANVPEELSLSQYLSSGLIDGEELLPEDSSASASGSAAATIASDAVVTPDDSLVAQLVSMGFSENGCKRAAIATKNANAETAMEWIFSHMEDPDFNDPPVLQQPQADASSSGASFNMEHVSMLEAMGFSEDQAKCALGQTDHSPDRAAEWLFSHIDDLDAAVAKAQSESSAAASSASAATGPAKRLDGTSGEYSLVGFVSHIGKNTNSGHYVSHIKKDGRWIIFNDDKVAVSEDPPLGSGYLYLFRRKDA